MLERGYIDVIVQCVHYVPLRVGGGSDASSFRQGELE